MKTDYWDIYESIPQKELGIRRELKGSVIRGGFSFGKQKNCTGLGGKFCIGELLLPTKKSRFVSLLVTSYPSKGYSFAFGFIDRCPSMFEIPIEVKLVGSTGVDNEIPQVALVRDVAHLLESEEHYNIYELQFILGISVKTIRGAMRSKGFPKGEELQKDYFIWHKSKLPKIMEATTEQRENRKLIYYPQIRGAK